MVRHVWPSEMVERAMQLMSFEVEDAERSAERSRTDRKMAFLKSEMRKGAH